MMRRSFARSCSFAVLALAAVAQAADAPPAGDGWSSYGVGTTVHTKSTTKTTMATPGAPAMPEQVTENRTTLVAVTEKEYTLKSEAKLGEEWSAQEIKLPRIAAGEAKPPEGAKVEELGNEAVTVEGASIPCKKTRTTLGANVTTTWTSEKHGLVKSEGKGPGSDYSSVLTKLSTKATAGGKELDCREMTTTAKAEGSESTIVMLTSDQIPGKTVRMESTTKIPQAQMTSTMVMEVVAFEIK
jgi:hypothetical protein